MANVKTVLIGTKSDLKDVNEDVRNGLVEAGQAIGNPISVEQGDALAKKINAFAYCETSAKTGDGILNAFDTVVRAAITPEKKGCKCVLL